MTDQIISCPKCGEQITLNDALTEKIRHQLEGEMSEELKRQKKQLEAEREEMLKAAQKKAAIKFNTEIKDLRKENEEKDSALEKMREQELELRKEKRKIVEEKKSMKLEIERKLDDERKDIMEQARKDAAEETHLKLAEKDKQIEQMKKSVEDLKRKSEQGSMQIQGDVQENELKIMLQNAFPLDLIEDVPAGIKGADLIQTVNTSFGHKTGVLLWESKNTKAWSGDWINKLKGDQALAKADVCVLVSQALPEDIKDFKYQEGAWVCSYQSALSLAAALRLQLTQLNQVKKSLVGKDAKMELLYNYLSGSEFQNRIENIVSAFTGMQNDLETEKRSMNRIWNKREKEIERVVMSTSGMYGDLQGIVGASLPALKSLEMPSADEPDIEKEK